MPINPIINNQIVLVRVCYDLPDLASLARIKDSISTIKNILSLGNKVVLLSHWGRPEGKFMNELSFAAAITTIQDEIISELENSGYKQFNEIQLEVLDQTSSQVDFEALKDYIKASSNKLFLLENTRFIADEQSDDKNTRINLAKKYASLGSFFVNEAFSISHRNEATVKELAELLPSGLGLSYQAEISNLDHLKYLPERPFSLVMGGAKLETKLPLISKLLPKADYLLLGGALGFTFLKAAGSNIELGLAPIEKEYLSEAKDLLNQFHNKIILPLDFNYIKINEGLLPADIGPETIKLFSEFIKLSKTIFWNGPMGKYEIKEFRNGTLQLATLIANQRKAFRVLGGGDTNASIPDNILQKMNFVSMGGGATLEYLAK